jgi:hypothetical protein
MLKVFNKNKCIDFALSILNNDSLINESHYNLDRLLCSKKILLNNIKKFWEIGDEIKNRNNINFINHDSFDVKTSGSTAQPFNYKLFFPTYRKIELDFHYNYILKEFNLQNNPIKILKLSPIKNIKNCEEIFFKKSKFYRKVFNPEENDFMYSHGSKFAICYYFQFHMEDIQNFLCYLNNFLNKNKIDIFFSSSSFLSLYYPFCKVDKICNLYSNTCEELNYKIINELVKNKLIDNYCDHMKCWDGGFGFFTCKNKTQHINELFCESETIENNLLTTDYFNFASSFVNYVNTDESFISDEWSRCECGRFYRKFEFLSSKKSFYVGKITSIDLYDIISSYGILMQAICYKNKIKIISSYPLKKNILQEIKYKIPVDLIFNVGNFEYQGRYNKLLRLVDKTNECI